MRVYYIVYSDVDTYEDHFEWQGVQGFRDMESAEAFLKQEGFKDIGGFLVKSEVRIYDAMYSEVKHTRAKIQTLEVRDEQE